MGQCFLFVKLKIFFSAVSRSTQLRNNFFNFFLKVSFSLPLFIKSAQSLIPELLGDDLETSGSGVRAQALTPGGQLVEDFDFQLGDHAVHVINASALDEFAQAVRSVGGQPDLELRARTGSAAGIEDTLLARMARHPDVALASPVLEVSSYALNAAQASPAAPTGESTVANSDLPRPICQPLGTVCKLKLLYSHFDPILHF